MTILTIIDTALLALALLFIVALLRSHADILRRLSVLEAGGAGASARAPGQSPDDIDLMPAIDIAGSTLNGDSVKLSLGPGSPQTLLAFLSSGCVSCGPLWEGMHDPSRVASLAERVVIVAHDASRESPARLRTLAPEGVDLILAGAAWKAYAVPASPHFVLTDGAGGVAGRGSALSWQQLSAMMSTAREDAGEAAVFAAHTTGERAARADRALARAGIGPGHPSLYPDDLGPAEPATGPVANGDPISGNEAGR